MDHFSRLEIPNFFSISILFILDRENFQLSIYLQNIRFSWWDEVRKLFSKRAKIKNVNIETEDWVMTYWRIVASLCSTSILCWIVSGIPRTTTGETFLFPSNKEFESDLSPADSAQSCRKRKFKHSTVICEVKKNFSGSPVLPDLLIYYKRNTRNYCVYSFLVTFLSLFLLGIFQHLCRCQEVKEVAAA